MLEFVLDLILLLFVSTILGRFSSNPGMEHYVATKKAMRYSQRTSNFMLVYRKVDHLEVIGYTYIDFAGYPNDQKSTSGYVFTLASRVISWKSVKQILVALSTMQAEFVVLWGCNLGYVIKEFYFEVFNYRFHLKVNHYLL